MPADPQAPKVDGCDGRDMLAALRAVHRVRDGKWIRGAHTHVLAEFLSALERDGWRLVPASVVDALREEVELSDSLYEEVLGVLEDAGVSHVGPAADDGLLPHRSAAERVGVLVAERDTLRDALHDSLGELGTAKQEAARLAARVRELEAECWCGCGDAAEVCATCAVMREERARDEGARQERERTARTLRQLRDEVAGLLPPAGEQGNHWSVLRALDTAIRIASGEADAVLSEEGS